MPQASEELRAKWGGDSGVGEDKAIAYLKGKGYRLTQQFGWLKPSPEHEPTDAEWEAMAFLVDEWDFGGIEDDDA